MWLEKGKHTSRIRQRSECPLLTALQQPIRPIGSPTAHAVSQRKNAPAHRNPMRSSPLQTHNAQETAQFRSSNDLVALFTTLNECTRRKRDHYQTINWMRKEGCSHHGELGEELECITSSWLLEMRCSAGQSASRASFSARTVLVISGYHHRRVSADTVREYRAVVFPAKMFTWA